MYACARAAESGPRQPADGRQSFETSDRQTDRHAHNAAVYNCLGAVLGQTGEATGALEAFKKSFTLSPHSPMPFLNAARVYQQLSQSDACEMSHLKEALRRDNTLVLAYVERLHTTLSSIEKH